jgi:hypothetical protein
MKYFIALFFIFVVAPYAFSQNIKITGTIFDPNGAVVTSSQNKGG